jgi:hypothetical protein
MVNTPQLDTRFCLIAGGQTTPFVPMSTHPSTLPRPAGPEGSSPFSLNYGILAA